MKFSTFILSLYTLTPDMLQAIDALNAMEVDHPPPTLRFRASFIHKINASAPSEHRPNVAASQSQTPTITIAPQVPQLSGSSADPSKEASRTASVPLASQDPSPPESEEDVIEEMACIHNMISRYMT
jgi:hypothetical protein